MVAEAYLAREKRKMGFGMAGIGGAEGGLSVLGIMSGYEDCLKADK
jgi:hypothetical protein